MPKKNGPLIKVFLATGNVEVWKASQIKAPIVWFNLGKKECIAFAEELGKCTLVHLYKCRGNCDTCRCDCQSQIKVFQPRKGD